MAIPAAILEPEALAGYFTRNPELARLNPDVVGQVNKALQAKAAAHTAAAPVVKSQPRPAASSSPSTLESIGRTSRQLDQLAPGRIPGRSGMVPRLIVAVIAGIAVLELVSYMTGNYFKYNLKDAPKNAAAAVKYVGLYGGQAAEVARLKAEAPAGHADPHGVPTGLTA